jgi:hypothetical protein
MKLYSMSLLPQPKNHTKRSAWQLDRYWEITKVSQLESAVNRIRSRTKYDGIARILGYGFPASKLELQQRLCTIKLGHDGLLFESKTPFYNEVASKLQQRGTP